jgi:hypothetical protein
MQGFSSIIKLELQQLSLFVKKITLSKLANLPSMKATPLELTPSITHLEP